MACLTDFLDQRPSRTHYSRLSPRADSGLHVCFWQRFAFPDLRALVTFGFRFSCVLQPYIADPTRIDLEEFFFPDEEAPESAEQFLIAHPTTDTDPVMLLNGVVRGQDVPWLQANQFEQTIIVADDLSIDVYAAGKEGFLHAFIADET